MAVFREIEDRGVKVILGKYEGEEYQDDLKFLEEDLAKKIVDFPLKRQKEILMTRRILRQFLPNYQLFYRVDGAPYLVPENKYISISHSFPWVAVAVSCEKIGIDLEKKQEKIARLKSKFLHTSEYSWIENEQENEYLWAIWTIKEAMYKIHPRKYWSFREHYKVEPFDIGKDKTIRCIVIQKDMSTIYSTMIYMVDDFILCIAKGV